MAYYQYPNLREAMNKRKVRLVDLAALLGRTKETISGWMRGIAGDFTVADAIAVWKKFFPEWDFFALFRHAKDIGKEETGNGQDV